MEVCSVEDSFAGNQSAFNVTHRELFPLADGVDRNKASYCGQTRHC